MEELEEGNADGGGMVQPSQQHVAPFIKGSFTKWTFGNKRFITKPQEVWQWWTCFGPVSRIEVTQEAYLRRSTLQTRCHRDTHPISCLIRHAGKQWVYSTPPPFPPLPPPTGGRNHETEKYSCTQKADGNFYSRHTDVSRHHGRPIEYPWNPSQHHCIHCVPRVERGPSIGTRYAPTGGY